MKPCKNSFLLTLLLLLAAACPVSAAETIDQLIAGAKKEARTRFLEFFTVNIRNPNTRAAYTCAALVYFPRAAAAAPINPNPYLGIV